MSVVLLSVWVWTALASGSLGFYEDGPPLELGWPEFHDMGCCAQPQPHPHPHHHPHHHHPPPPPFPPEHDHTWVSGFMDTGTNQIRLRTGTGDFTMYHDSAELCCYFPPNIVLLSNVVWQRLKNGKDSRHGDWLEAGQKYSLDSVRGGSALTLYDPSYLDRGIYRCMATALDTEMGRSLTVFQDVYFYP